MPKKKRGKRGREELVANTTTTTTLDSPLPTATALIAPGTTPGWLSSPANTTNNSPGFPSEPLGPFLLLVTFFGLLAITMAVALFKVLRLKLLQETQFEENDQFHQYEVDEDENDCSWVGLISRYSEPLPMYCPRERLPSINYTEVQLRSINCTEDQLRSINWTEEILPTPPPSGPSPSRLGFQWLPWTVQTSEEEEEEQEVREPPPMYAPTLSRVPLRTDSLPPPFEQS